MPNNQNPMTTHRMFRELMVARTLVDDVLEMDGCDLLPVGWRMRARATKLRDSLAEMVNLEIGAAALLRRMLDGKCETVLDPDVHAAFIAEARAVLGRKPAAR